MKQIYFVLTDTGTILSKIVKQFMKDEYGHISISLDKELEQMYSFGRLNPYNTFYGGFVHEHVHSGTFKRFKNTKTKILEYEIKDDQYEKLEQAIRKIETNKKDYKFNALGLFGVYFNKKVIRDNYFYCAEFVNHVLKEADINLDMPELIRPENFKDISERIIYKGLLREYC